MNSVNLAYHALYLLSATIAHSSFSYTDCAIFTHAAECLPFADFVLCWTNEQRRAGQDGHIQRRHFEARLRRAGLQMEKVSRWQMHTLHNHHTFLLHELAGLHISSTGAFRLLCGRFLQAGNVSTLHFSRSDGHHHEAYQALVVLRHYWSSTLLDAHAERLFHVLEKSMER